MPGASTRQDEYFRFLRRLRAEGRSNMYGAVPYLMTAFALDRELAFKVVCQWIDQQSLAASLEPASPRPKTLRHQAA
jgi:hypothetical protein